MTGTGPAPQRERLPTGFQGPEEGRAGPFCLRHGARSFISLRSWTLGDLGVSPKDLFEVVEVLIVLGSMWLV